MWMVRLGGRLKDGGVRLAEALMLHIHVSVSVL